MHGQMKRRRETQAGDVRDAAKVFLAAAGEWTDTCGRLYKISNRLEENIGYARLKIGHFDRVTVRQLSALAGISAGEYRAECLEIDMKSRAVVCKLIRGAVEERSVSKHLKLSQALAVDSTLPELKRVDKCDIQDVSSALRRVVQGCGSSSARADVRRLPSSYELSVPIDADGYEWECIGQWERSFIDMENRRAVVVVDRKNPDI